MSAIRSVDYKTMVGPASFLFGMDWGRKPNYSAGVVIPVEHRLPGAPLPALEFPHVRQVIYFNSKPELIDWSSAPDLHLQLNEIQETIQERLNRLTMSDGSNGKF